MTVNTKDTPLKKRKEGKFLNALSQTGMVIEACHLAVVSRVVVYRWRKRDPEFAKRWDEAIEQAADVLEREAFRRAVEGIDEPVYQGGQLVGVVRKYSDTMLIFLLKGARPNKYRERREITGEVGISLAQDMKRIRAQRWKDAASAIAAAQAADDVDEEVPT